MSNLRVFIAVTIDDRTKERISQIQEFLKKIGDGVRWVRPQAMHLTLKFLGEIVEDELDRIYEASLRAVCQKKLFPISFGGFGVFPNLTSPRVIWMGIEEGREELVDLAKNLEVELAKIGYPPEKRGFTPHLTLGRVKGWVDRRRLENVLVSYQIEGIRGIEAEKIEVMKSDLRPTGAIHTSLREFRLGKER